MTSIIQPCVTQIRRYHECPGCRIETWNEYLCPDCLAWIESLAKQGMTVRLADVQESTEKKSGVDWRTAILLSLFIPMFFLIAVAVSAYLCECVHLWTGIPWP